jgi:hypothetical protein
VAIFNPDVPTTDADYTRNSQGYKPDMSKASLFEDIGNIYTAGVKAVDTLFKSVIRDEATEGVDEIRDREINMGAQQEGYGTQPPKEIDNAATRLGVMRSAKQSGQVGDSHYMLLLDAEARRLRSRYPGHREYIDNVIQDLTGTTPANRAIDLMKSELRKEGKDTQLENEYHWARQNGGPLAELLAKGQTPDLSVSRQLNASHGLYKASLEDTTKKITISKGTREEREASTERAATGLLAMHLDNQEKAATTASGMTYEKLQSIREDMGKTAPTAQQEEQLKIQIDQYVNEQNMEFNKFMRAVHTDAEGNKFTFGSELSNEAKARMHKNFQDKLESQIKPLVNKDYAGMTRNAAYAESKVNENMRKLVDVDIAARQAAYKKILGDQSFQFFSSTSGQALAAQQQTFRDFILAGVSRPLEGSLQEDIKKARDLAKESGMPDEKFKQVQKVAIDDMVKHIKEQSSNTKLVEYYATRLFDNREGNKDWYANANPGTREYLYDQFMQPGVVKAITAPGVNPEVVQNYHKWVESAASDRMEGPKSQTAVLAQQLDRGTYPYTLKFDPTTALFSVVPNPLNPRPIVANAETGALRTTTALAEEMNRTTRGYKNVAESLGYDQAFVSGKWENSLRNRGLDLDADDVVVSSKYKQAIESKYKTSGISAEPSGSSEQPKTSEGEGVRTKPSASEQRPTFGMPPESVRPGNIEPPVKGTGTTIPKTSNQFTLVPDEAALEEIRKDWQNRRTMDFKGTGRY